MKQNPKTITIEMHPTLKAILAAMADMPNGGTAPEIDAVTRTCNPAVTTNRLIVLQQRGFITRNGVKVDAEGKRRNIYKIIPIGGE
jgi:hypothetical protein